MAIAIVIAMLGVLILRQGSGTLLAGGDLPATFESVGLTTNIAPSPMSEALPLVYIAVKADGTDASRVAASLRAAPERLRHDRLHRSRYCRPDRSSRHCNKLHLRCPPGPGAGDITIELQSVATGRVLSSRNLTAADSAPSAVEDRVAGILSSALPASGTIYGYIEQSGIQNDLTQCLLLNGKYYLDQNARTHEAAYRRLETLADNGAKSSLVYSELASLHLEAVNDHYAYPPDATIEKAMTFAHRAVQMGPTSPYAHRSYGYINSRLGNADEALRWMRKAYDLNPYDVAMAATYGYGLVFAGRYAEGTPLLAHAVDASSGHPTWWDFGLFAGELMLGDANQAAIASSALRTTATKSHYLAARLIGARISGQDGLARKLLDELNTKFPKFAADPRTTFVERKYPADLTDRLVGALRAAGLGNAS